MHLRAAAQQPHGPGSAAAETPDMLSHHMHGCPQENKGPMMRAALILAALLVPAAGQSLRGTATTASKVHKGTYAPTHTRSMRASARGRGAHYAGRG
jgi:hypothetical protein